MATNAPNPPAAPDPGEPTWAVIVVHGVGITKPGHTVENLLTTLGKMDRDALAVEDPPEVCLLAEEGEPATADEPLAGRFPMHQRRAAVNSSRGGPRRAVFAEVYWADLSGSSRGFWDWGGEAQTVFRVFTLLFQLRYLAHMAATHYQLRSAYWLRWFAGVVSWALSGPIAGPNAFAFYLLVAHFLTIKSRDLSAWAGRAAGPEVGWLFATQTALALGAGLIALGVGLLWYGHRAGWSAKGLFACAALAGWGGGLVCGNSFLLQFADPTRWQQSQAQLMGFGAAASVLGFLCLVLIRTYEKDGIWFSVLIWFTLSGVATMILMLLPFVATLDALKESWGGRRLEKLFPDLLTKGLFDTVLTAFLCWVITFFGVLGAGVLAIGYPLWFWSLRETRSPEHAAARPALTAAFVTALVQLGFWVLLVPLLGMGALLYLDPHEVSGKRTSAFAYVWTRFTFNLCLAAVPVAVAIAVWVARRYRARPFRAAPSDPAEPPPQPPIIARLIAHHWVFGAIILVTFIGFASFLHSSLTNNHWIHERMEGLQWWLIGSSLGVIALAYLVGQRELMAGLHILRDVVGHFYRTDNLTSDLWSPVAAHVESATFADRFVLERQIERRFVAVLRHVLRAGNITRLTVVAHSQGTVATLLSLYPDEARALLRENGVREVRLVTMGSPFTHLYQHYFPYRYPPLYTSAGAFNTGQWRHLREVLTHWLNVYRIDDFIGTSIAGDEAGAFPRNQWVYGSGHTGYWVDATALGAIRGWLPGCMDASPPWP